MFDKADFLDRVADILEVPEVIPEFEFRSAPGWGSMMGFALYVMLEDEYGVKITPERFRELKTVSGLMSPTATAYPTLARVTAVSEPRNPPPPVINATVFISISF